MAKAKQGDTVTIHVTEKLEDGTEVYSTRSRDPLTFTIGERKLIPGLGKAVIGMELGERRTKKVPPDQAFGQHDDELIINVDRKCIPDKIKLEVGKELYMNRTEDSQKTRVRIIEVSESTVAIDMNHPLAGKELIFDIELLALA